MNEHLWNEDDRSDTWRLNEADDNEKAEDYTSFSVCDDVERSVRGTTMTDSTDDDNRKTPIIVDEHEPEIGTYIIRIGIILSKVLKIHVLLIAIHLLKLWHLNFLLILKNICALFSFISKFY